MANGFPSALSCLTSWVGTTFTPLSSQGAELNLDMAQMAEYASPLLPPGGVWGPQGVGLLPLHLGNSQVAGPRHLFPTGREGCPAQFRR